jgi:hypothetical protein
VQAPWPRDAAAMVCSGNSARHSTLPASFSLVSAAHAQMSRATSFVRQAAWYAKQEPTCIDAPLWFAATYRRRLSAHALGIPCCWIHEIPRGRWSTTSVNCSAMPPSLDKSSCSCGTPLMKMAAEEVDCAGGE